MDVPDKTLIIDNIRDNRAESADAGLLVETSYPPKPSQRSLWSYMRSDLNRYRVTDDRSALAVFFISSEILACIVYRWGHWVWSYTGPLIGLVRLLKPVYIIINRIMEVITGVTIRPRARIGQGLYITHIGSIHIGAHVVIGENCNISQEVTIGVGGRGANRGSPTIGNRVFIAPGAKLFGPIVIGDDVAIGANAVVTKSLPDRAVAVGIPAEIMSYEGSFEFVLYDGMEHDQERLRNLAAREADRASVKTAR